MNKPRQEVKAKHGGLYVNGKLVPNDKEPDKEPVKKELPKLTKPAK